MLNQYLKDRFGCKVYKIALDGGFTCPNRDGALDTRGCIFSGVYRNVCADRPTAGALYGSGKPSGYCSAFDCDATGLPGESVDDMIATVQYVVVLDGKDDR